MSEDFLKDMEAALAKLQQQAPQSMSVLRKLGEVQTGAKVTFGGQAVSTVGALASISGGEEVEFSAVGVPSGGKSGSYYQK